MQMNCLWSNSVSAIQAIHSRMVQERHPERLGIPYPGVRYLVVLEITLKYLKIKLGGAS